MQCHDVAREVCVIVDAFSGLLGCKCNAVFDVMNVFSSRDSGQWICQGCFVVRNKITCWPSEEITGSVIENSAWQNTKCPLVQWFKPDRYVDSYNTFFILISDRASFLTSVSKFRLKILLMYFVTYWGGCLLSVCKY